MADVEMNRENKLCASCRKIAKLFCSKCKVTPYCSMECQRDKWSLHKTVCKLNSPTPLLSSITKIDFDKDFDKEYSYVVIKSSDAKKLNTLPNTIERFVGLDEFDPSSTPFQWNSVSDDIVSGFSHEDKHVYRVYSPLGHCNTEHNDEGNNLASQFLMKPNSVGSFVIYKTEPSIFDSDEDSTLKNDGDETRVLMHGTDRDVPVGDGSGAISDGTRSRHLKLTRREVWEITEYRHFCSFDKVVSDRVHRANMQRGEGLKALKQTKFTVIDS